MIQIATKNVELPSQLIDHTNATTVGDVLAIDFPVAVGSIDTKRLARYADDADMRLYDPFDEDGPKPHLVSDVRLMRSGHLRGRPGVDNIHPAFSQCAAITRELESQLLEYRRENDTDTYRLIMEGRANPLPKDMPGVVKLGPSVHVDLTENPPNGRRYIAQSETPTLFVSHADTLTILKDIGYEAVLGLEINPNSYDLKTLQHFFYPPMMPLIELGISKGHSLSRLRAALNEALQPCKDGTLTAFTSLTFHAVPSNIERGRVIFEADAHNTPDYRYNPHAELFDVLELLAKQ